jgi:hypothetical protein
MHEAARPMAATVSQSFLLTMEFADARLLVFEIIVSHRKKKARGLGHRKFCGCGKK